MSLDIDRQLKAAMEHYASSRLHDAEAGCHRILKVDPDQPVALHMLGMIAHQVKQNGPAIELILKALSVAPGYAEAHLNLGVVMQSESRLAEAYSCFKRALEIDHNLPGGLKNLGMVLHQMGQDTEAKQVLQAGLARNPRDEDIADYLKTIVDQTGINFTKIRVENTNACQYACEMCPREKMSRKVGVMPPEDYRFFLGRLNDYVVETGLSEPYASTFFLHGFGEPLLDQKLAEKGAMVVEIFPASQSQILTTLGVRRSESYLRSLLEEGGLKYIIVSLYGFQEKTYSKVQHAGSYRTVRENLIFLAKLNKDLGNPCKISVQLLVPHTQTVIDEDPAEKKAFEDLMTIIEPLGVTLDTLSLHNFGDGRDYHPSAREKTMCSVVNGRRRTHLNVTWDLKVLPCCFDYNAEVVLGDLREDSIKQIYEGENYRRFLDAHRNGNFDDYPLCKACDQR